MHPFLLSHLKYNYENIKPISYADADILDQKRGYTVEILSVVLHTLNQKENVILIKHYITSITYTLYILFYLSVHDDRSKKTGTAKCGKK